MIIYIAKDSGTGLAGSVIGHKTLDVQGNVAGLAPDEGALFAVLADDLRLRAARKVRP